MPVEIFSGNGERGPALFSALCACFGLAPSSPEASALIREAYQEPENAPRPPRSANVVYYSVFPDDAPEPPPEYTAENPERASHVPAVSFFSACRLQIVCYGPQALANARTIRAFLYADGPGMPRAILRKAGLYPVPPPPEPVLLHEPEGSLWRARADLAVSLRAAEKETYAGRRGAVAAAPAVVLHPRR